MATANPYDPKNSSVTVQYVTPTNATTQAIQLPYSGTTLVELSPKGTIVQAGGAAW